MLFTKLNVEFVLKKSVNFSLKNIAKPYKN